LGLFINNVRKKTVDQDLAKRCRKLVKSWQQLANSSPSSNASPAYYSPALSVSKQPHTNSAYVPSSSPALQLVNPRRISPASTQQSTVPERLVSPLVRPQSGRNSPAIAQVKRISPSNSSRSATPKSCAILNKLSVSPSQSSSRPSTPIDNNNLNSTLKNHTSTPILANNHSNFTPHLDTTNRTHAANKKRRRSGENSHADNASKKTRTVINGEFNKLPERIKVSKVKTTAQLIEELQADKSTRLTKSDTINKIVTNQIQKEEDDINLSVVPASARPKSRGRKSIGSGLPSLPSDISKVKSELVERYLKNHLDNKHSDDTEIDVIGDDLETLKNDQFSATSNHHQKTNGTTFERSVDPYSLLPPIDFDSIHYSEDEEDVDAPIRRNPITGEYPDGYTHSEDSNVIPDEGTVEKVVNCNWNGVNGTTNVNSQFHTWTETFSIQSNDREQTEFHVLLPYVDL